MATQSPCREGRCPSNAPPHDPSKCPAIVYRKSDGARIHPDGHKVDENGAKLTPVVRRG